MTILSFMCWPKHSNRWKLVVKMETQQSYFPFCMISFCSYKCLFQLTCAELLFLYQRFFSFAHSNKWCDLHFSSMTLDRKRQRLGNIISNYNLVNCFLTCLLFLKKEWIGDMFILFINEFTVQLFIMLLIKHE